MMVDTRDGRAFLWTFAFPRSSIFPSRSAFLFDIFFCIPMCSHFFAFICTSILYWREAGLRSNSCLVHNPPLPPLLSVHVITHYCVISSEEREFNIPILLCSPFPRSCIKFPFLKYLKRGNAKSGMHAHLW